MFTKLIRQASVSAALFLAACGGGGGGGGDSSPTSAPAAAAPLAPAPVAAPSTATLRYDITDRGIENLSMHGVDFVMPNRDWWWGSLADVSFDSGLDGLTREAPSPTAFEFAGRVIAFTYPMARIVGTYRDIGKDTLEVEFAVTNTSNIVLKRVSASGLRFRLPGLNLPVTTGWDTGPMRSRRFLVSSRVGTYAVVLSLDDQRKVLFTRGAAFDSTAAFSVGPANAGENEPVRLSWAIENLAPGQTKRMSFRLSEAKGNGTFDANNPQGGVGLFEVESVDGSDSVALASMRSSGERPPVANAWTDRRPIGRWFISGSCGRLDQSVPANQEARARNPRSYPPGCQADMRTDAGKQALRDWLLREGQRQIDAAKRSNAQGLIIWDIEGQEAPHAISYICDPTQLARPDHEMNYRPPGAERNTADELVHRIRSAGLRVGFCLRPQRYLPSSSQWGVDQFFDPDAGKVIREKVDYVVQRWGADEYLFYVDSNVATGQTLPGRISSRAWELQNSFVIPADQLFSEALEAHPTARFLPEWETPSYFIVGSRYFTEHWGARISRFRDLIAQPGGFSGIMTNYTLTGENRASFEADWKRAVRRGDILLGDLWNGITEEMIRNAYSIGARPIVTVGARRQNGETRLTADASDPDGRIDRVEWYSGQARIGVDNAAPYEQVWVNPPAFRHALVARAVDRDGNETWSAPMTFDP